jgi:hypothetical protein
MDARRWCRCIVEGKHQTAVYSSAERIIGPFSSHLQAFRLCSPALGNAIRDANFPDFQLETELSGNGQSGLLTDTCGSRGRKQLPANSILFQ